VSARVKDCLVVYLGYIDYAEALRLQMQICAAKKLGFDQDVLLLLQHPPTITLGRNGKWNHLLVARQELQSRNIGCFDTDRGGDITFHGPGQLVGYPILKLEEGERDVHLLMRNLEESLIRLLGGYDIHCTRDQRYTGVWTEQGKIAAMGIHISRWITRHGFALNVNTDLEFFDLIIPCGIAGGNVTSMAKMLSRHCDLTETAERFAREFGPIFGRKMIRIEPSELSEKLRLHGPQTSAA
jgi:lipoate-protein ligase B